MGDDLANCSNPSVVCKLDISCTLGAVSAAASDQRYTDMLEAACVAVIRIERAEGQASAPSEVLATALDDAVTVWSQVGVGVGIRGAPIGDTQASACG